MTFRIVARALPAPLFLVFTPAFSAENALGSVRVIL
jgi:hypothetical protein